MLAACATLEHDYGVAVTYLPVDRDGLVDPAAVEAALRPETVLVSLMAANNETGTLQPVREVGAITGAYGVLLHVDAAQAVGKVEVDVASWGADLLTVVGHKMYAPKGIGALYVAPGVTLRPLVAGGGQERGLRAGTENVAFAVALGAAADLARAELAAGRPEVLAGMRDLLEARLTAQLPGRVRLTATASGGCRRRSTSASTASVATSCSPPCRTSPPRPGRPVTRVRTRRRRSWSPWVSGPSGPWPRCGCRSAGGARRRTSRGRGPAGPGRRQLHHRPDARRRRRVARQRRRRRLTTRAVSPYAGGNARRPAFRGKPPDSFENRLVWFLLCSGSPPPKRSHKCV